ncbi:acyl-CoA N-acyltransferase [Cyathus striatus]|nr:acyl-CoA N-acyltransferase [Cyathus striatus]
MQHLEHNPKTNEAFLRLDSPQSNIIITPPRLEDAFPSTVILNDSRIYPRMGFGGPDNPYTMERAYNWIGCPFRHIRKLNDDGTDEFLGDIGIERANWTKIPDLTERERLIAENKKLASGNPDIIWQLGYYLAPKYQGLGIMSSVIETVIRKWAVPHMAAHHIRATAFHESEGSIRVLEKNGFRLTKTVNNCIVIGGESRSLHVLEWHIA